MLAISCILGLFTSELKGERLPDGARRRHRSESASDTVKVMPAGFQQLGGEVRRQKEKKTFLCVVYSYIYPFVTYLFVTVDITKRLISV